MKHLLIFIIAFMLTSCKEKYEKPFTIIGKSGDCVSCDDNNYSYTFQDSLGNKGFFQDHQDKYEIGDVIK